MLGYGISNQSLSEYFKKNKIDYLLYDDYLEEFHQDIDLNRFDIMVKSPVITPDHYLVQLAKRLNKPIITDLELFYSLQQTKTFITVTGTNGKTTTVKLIKHLLNDLDLGGNVGIPLFNFIDSPRDIIIEASSFMLEYTIDFHSKYNLILNITPNHLDHHQTFGEYTRCKLKLLKNITAADYLIYNYDDLLLRRLVSNYQAKLIPFSLVSKVNGGYLLGDYLYYQNQKIINVNNIQLLGKHNLANILASICVVLNYRKDLSSLESRVKTFQAVEHRIEYLGEFDEIKVYNDSKSTNYRALKIALDAFLNEEILLVCGGKTRIDNINLLNNSLTKLKQVLVNGENQGELIKYFKSKNIPVMGYCNLENLLDNIIAYLKPGLTILFSPGSSSYDQFKNFEQRGLYFKKRILQILG